MPEFLQVENNRYIDIAKIVWVRHTDNVFNICTKTSGCSLDNNEQTHNVSKDRLPDSYNILKSYIKNNMKS